MNDWNRWDWLFTVGPFVVLGGIAALSILSMRRRMR